MWGDNPRYVCTLNERVDNPKRGLGRGVRIAGLSHRIDNRHE